MEGNNVKGVTDGIAADEVYCVGNLCGHAPFKLSAKGCNSILRLCPACTQGLSDAIDGKGSIILYIRQYNIGLR